LICAEIACPSSISGGSSFRDTEGIRRINELYLGDNGRYAFNNRSILESAPSNNCPALLRPVSTANSPAGASP